MLHRTFIKRLLIITIYHTLISLLQSLINIISYQLQISLDEIIELMFTERELRFA